MRAVDAQLRQYFSELEKTHGPLTVSEVLERAEPEQTIPDLRPAGTPSLRTRRWALAAVVVLLIGLTIIVGSLGGHDTQPVDQHVTTTILGPTSTSGGLEGSATLDTPIGTAGWWHIAGDEASIPDDGGWVIETPDGYAMIVGPWGVDVEYWTSRDARSWNLQPFPEGLLDLEGATWVQTKRVGTATWLQSDKRDSVWRYQDGAWTRLDLPEELTRYSLDGIDEQVWITATDPVGLWRLDGETWVAVDSGVTAQDLDEGGFRVRPSRGNGTTMVSWDADTLTVIDPAGSAAVLTPPWADQLRRDDASIPDEVTVLAHDQGFVAFVVEWVQGTACPSTQPDCETFPDVGLIRSWTSGDGFEWTGPLVPEFLTEGDGDFGHFGQFQAVGSILIANVGGYRDNPESFDTTSQVWVSQDGLEWDLTALPQQGTVSVDPVGSGWLCIGDFPQNEVWVSPDLRDWQPVDTSDLGILADQERAGTVMWASTGDIFYVIQGAEADTPADMWILDFGN